ncbi:MAG: SUMF1/EgtB/PvdO family nonheme iron enzyme [Kiritimatiellaeota bacterium]|nr:SUMF1/EgtB/PvdO family nonheme iron enzyme [Kiritimatiellota bacterium]
MKRFAVFMGLLFAGLSAAAQDALPTQGLVYRLDAAKAETLTVEGGGVAAWRDADGRAVAFAQDAAGARPAFNPDAFGGRGGVAFGEKSSTRLATGFSAPLQTVFIVARLSAGPGLGGVWGQSGGDHGIRAEMSGAAWRFPGAANDNDFMGPHGLLFVNGVPQEGQAETLGEAHVLTAVSAAPVNWPTALGNYWAAGDGAGRYFRGDVGEVLVYDSALSEDAREAVEAHLVRKWGIPRIATLTGARRTLARRLQAVNVEAVALAVADMAERWPADCKAPAWLATLAADRDALLARLPDAKDEAVVADAERFVGGIRAALLNLPMLRDAQLLLVKRGHNNLALPANWDNVCSVDRKGLNNSIVLMSNLRGKPEVREVVAPRRPNDYFGELALHWDAKRLMFTSNNEKGKCRVYEVSLDAPDAVTEMPQIPDDDVDNYAGCWLADDATLFLSTATMIGVPCVRGSSPIAHIYRQDNDGIRRLTFDQEHNWYPTMLADGRVMYLRWEYSDIPHFVARILFTMNPDGSAQREHYGSNSYWPNSVFYTKPIPDDPRRFAGIVTGHHGVCRMGELVVFDPSQGRFETEGVVQRIPGRGQKVEATLRDELVNDSWPKFLHPEPLGGAYFLAAVKPAPSVPWGLYLVDMFDNMTLIAEDPQFAYLEPTLIRAKPRPPVLPSQIAKGKPGYIKIVDIYAGPGLAGVPRGAVKSLRIGSYAFSYRGMGGQYDRVGLDGPWDVRRILGTVPVESDGSAYFEIPPNTPIMIQPLDADGRALQLMRSWVMSMPGEMQTCVGCHEPLNSSTPAHRIEAVTRQPVKITPWHGPARGFSFNREVQPVLDRHCVKCHDGTKAGRPDFTLRPDVQQKTDVYRAADFHFPPAYTELRKRIRGHTIESDMHLLMPCEFHANTTDLVRMLEAGHNGVKLDPESWDRLNTWIDLNTPAHGTWTEIVGEAKVKHYAARRRELLNRYAGIDEDPEDNELREGLRGQGDKGSRGQGVKELRNPEEVPPPVLRPTSIPLTPEPLDPLTPEPLNPLTPKITIAQKPVTNRDYAEFDPAHFSGIETGDFLQFSTAERGFRMDDPDQPVVRVSQQQALAYCEWLSKKTGKRHRLPTAAERQRFAQQALDGRDNFAGIANLADKAFNKSNKLPSWRPADTNLNDGFRVTSPVGSFAPDAHGLHDVFGNVWEWTSSDDPSGRAIAMGGSFATHPAKLTPRSCVTYPPWQRVFDVGFRVVTEE